MDQNIPPRRAARPGSTDRTRKNRNVAESLTRRAPVRKHPLNSLAKALPPELWASLRWQTETEVRR
jgi:hypothetical protein